MYFTFNHSYEDIHFNVECEYEPNISNSTRPIIEWYAQGFKNLREIIEAAKVNWQNVAEETFTLQCEIENECVRIGKRAERETDLIESILDQVELNKHYIKEL